MVGRGFTQASVVPSETRLAVVHDFTASASSNGRPMVAPARDGGLLLTTRSGSDGLGHLTLEGGRIAAKSVSLPGFEELEAVRAIGAGMDGDVYVCTTDALLRVKVPER